MKIFAYYLQILFANPNRLCRYHLRPTSQIESFCDKIESVQYKASLAITGAIQGTSRSKLYQELGLESLKSRRCKTPKLYV